MLCDNVGRRPVILLFIFGSAVSYLLAGWFWKKVSSYLKDSFNIVFAASINETLMKFWMTTYLIVCDTFKIFSLLHYHPGLSNILLASPSRTFNDIRVPPLSATTWRSLCWKRYRGTRVHQWHQNGGEWLWFIFYSGHGIGRKSSDLEILSFFECVTGPFQLIWWDTTVCRNNNMQRVNSFWSEALLILPSQMDRKINQARVGMTIGMAFVIGPLLGEEGATDPFFSVYSIKYPKICKKFIIRISIWYTISHISRRLALHDIPKNTAVCFSFWCFNVVHIRVFQSQVGCGEFSVVWNDGPIYNAFISIFQLLWSSAGVIAILLPLPSSGNPCMLLQPRALLPSIWEHQFSEFRHQVGDKTWRRGCVLFRVTRRVFFFCMLIMPVNLIVAEDRICLWFAFLLTLQVPLIIWLRRKMTL